MGDLLDKRRMPFADGRQRQRFGGPQSQFGTERTGVKLAVLFSTSEQRNEGLSGNVSRAYEASVKTRRYFSPIIAKLQVHLRQQLQCFLQFDRLLDFQNLVIHF